MSRTLTRIVIALVLILALLILGYCTLFSRRSEGTRIGSVSTTFRLIGPNDKVAINRFDDTDVEGVACYLARARTGGLAGAAGTAEDPSELSISCARAPTVAVKAGVDLARSNGERVFSERASVLFKTIEVRRFYDSDRNALCYIVVSTKIVNGSPTNAMSCVNIDAAR